ncbi:MAG: tetratricopeptide repeat protein [Myxococcota bacterium]|nr:tetratricopeptide repeat protein [Myxococcota bacterium]
MLRLLIFTGVICPLGAFGCAANKGSLEATVKTLEQEVTRLKTERVNLNARNRALDDEMLVLKKRLSRCQQGASPRLAVVKLHPDTVSDAEPPEWATLPVEANPAPKPKGPRPKLVLSGPRQRSTRPSSAATAIRPDNAEPLEALPQDNLGVVPLDNTDPIQMDGFQAAYRAYANKQYKEALGGFSDFLRHRPQHQYADDAIFWRAECYISLGQLFKAIGELERLVARFPKSEKIPTGLYRIGFAYDKLRDRQKALEYYYRVVDQYPGSDAARRASHRVSTLTDKSDQTGRLVPAASKR